MQSYTLHETLRKTNAALLVTIHQFINHTNTPIEKFISMFTARFGSAFTLSTNDDVALFLSNSVSCELLHFYTDLELEKIDPTEWLSVYHDELKSNNHSSKEDVERLKDQINDELRALIREFFTFSPSDFTTELQKLSKDLVLLVLQCLALTAELFMPEPIQDELSLRFSSFWNARLENDIIESAELICVPIVQKVFPDENDYSVKTHTISVSAVTTEAPLSPYTPTIRKKVSFIDEEIISRFSEVSDGSESINVGKKSLIVISEDSEKINSELIDSQSNDNLNSSGKIIHEVHDNKENNSVPNVHENEEITSNNLEINPITIITNTGKRFEVEMPTSPTLKGKKSVRFNAKPKIKELSLKTEQFSNSPDVKVDV